MKNKMMKKAVTIGAKVKQKAALAAATFYVAMNGMMFSAYAGNFDNVNIDCMSANKVFAGILTMLSTIGKYIGAMAVAGGVFMYLQAKKDDNPNAESKAQMAIGVGIAFFIIPTLLESIFVRK